MNERSVEHVSRFSVTHASADGVISHTEVRITRTGIVDDPVPSGAQDAGECFDPSTCCSSREQAMIAALRAYLRPQCAPESLKSRLRTCLDRCCCEDDDPTGR